MQYAGTLQTDCSFGQGRLIAPGFLVFTKVVVLTQIELDELAPSFEHLENIRQLYCWLNIETSAFLAYLRSEIGLETLFVKALAQVNSTYVVHTVVLTTLTSVWL